MATKQKGAKKRSARKRSDLKQTFIAGTEPPSIKEIDQQADKYRDVRDHRKDLVKDEIEERDRLTALMEKHGLQKYVYDGYEVEIMAGDPVAKVRKHKEPKQDNG